MRRLGEADLTKCVKCGRTCIKKYAEKQKGLCLDCHDTELENTLGLESYKRMIQEQILEQPILVRMEEGFCEATIVEVELYERGRCPKCGRRLTWSGEVTSLFQCEPCGLILFPSSKNSKEVTKIMEELVGKKAIELNVPLKKESHHFANPERKQEKTHHIFD